MQVPEAQQPSASAGDDGILLVPLGCSFGTERTLQEMGRGAGALPFDRVMVSHEGLLHFLRKGFEAPTRGGLGAGGQRPAEKHGFLDFTTRKPVPGTDLMMCRSHLHSFWFDDVADPEVRAACRSRIERFEGLGGAGKALLFVRAVATTAELARIDELLSALTKKFGPQACLLVIVDFQKAHPGTYVVDGYEDLLVCFLSGEEHDGGLAAAPYRKAVECALGWLHGDPLEAASFADLRTLQGYADDTCWGLVGLGGLNAFEGASRRPDDLDAPSSPVPSAEDAWLEEAKMEAAKESVAVLSLGGHPATALAIKKADLPYEASPFDNVEVRVEGIVKSLQTSFEGFVGAHPQATETTIEHFQGWLAKSDRPKLFVHATEAVEDLGAIAGLLAALGSHFSGQTCLLVIVCGQQQPRLLSVEGHYNVLVNFVSVRLHAASDGSALSEPIRHSLDWVVGKPVQASVVKDFESLQALAAPP